MSASILSSGCQFVLSTPSSHSANGNSTPSTRSRHSASSIIGPWASKLAIGKLQTIAAAASNKRPAALVTGQLRSLSHAALATPSESGVAAQSSPHSQCKAAALRQGSRPALSPPGRRKVRKLAKRCQLPGRPSSASPPHKVPSRPSPMPSHANISQSPGRSSSAATALA